MSFEYSMAGKWLELLKQIAPGVNRVAVLRDAVSPSGNALVRCHPGYGAVCQSRGDPGQHARRR